MKRPVIEGDFRSNVSQGSEPENIKLTELEIEECLRAAKAVNGLWSAVDFIPSKNREKEPPYFLEVNSSPGTEGIEDATNSTYLTLLSATLLIKIIDTKYQLNVVTKKWSQSNLSEKLC
jgi:ribosomal protein S6--L-glutamate ligase